MTHQKQQIRRVHPQNDLRHWCVYRMTFGETRGRIIETSQLADPVLTVW